MNPHFIFFTSGWMSLTNHMLAISYNGYNAAGPGTDADAENENGTDGWMMGEVRCL